MFNKDNYHWTQDDYTAEGIEVMRKVLQEKGISLEDDGSSIYLTQRMGTYHVRFDLSVTLSKEETHLSIAGYTGVSSEEEIEDSPIKKIFIESVEKMKEELIKKGVETEDKKDTKIHQTEKIVIPKTENHAKTETLKKTVRFSGPKDRIKRILFEPGLLQACNRLITTEEHPFKILHPAIKITDISEKAAENKKDLKIEKELKIEIEGKSFSTEISIQTKGEGTVLKISSSSVPSNYSSKFISYFENILLKPIEATFHIPYTIE